MRRLVDISRYQVERPNPIDLVKVKAAGYDVVNVALTGGRGYVSGSWAKTYLDEAKALGLGRSTYHWLDGRTTGAFQATAQLVRLKMLFGADLTGFAHFVDVEEDGKHGIAPPTWAHVRDYVTTMQAALGRPIGIYSADYWWQTRAWNGASLTPYLMGPPNSPVSKAPLADSTAWRAGWGGWQRFSVLQWGVGPMPGTGDCSLSVIRDDAVWAGLTARRGVPMAWGGLNAALTSWRAGILRRFPKRGAASDGGVADAAHGSNSQHQRDADSTVDAFDCDVNWLGSSDPDGTALEDRISEAVKADFEADPRANLWIHDREIANHAIGDWRERAYGGASPHTAHIHFESRQALEDDGRPWAMPRTDALLRELTGDDDDMATITQADFNARMDEWFSSRMSAVADDNPSRTALRVAPWHQKVGAASSTVRTYDVLAEIRANTRAILEASRATLNNVVGDDGDLAEIKAHVDEQVAGAARDIIEGMVADGASSDELARALRLALGSRATEVGAKLAAAPGK